MTDDAALARALARRGWRIAFRDAGPLLAVDMHDSMRETWREWGRSIALSDVTPPGWQVADVTTLWLTLALPWLRVIARRAGPIDAALLALRWLLALPLAASYTRRGPTYWLSPLADPFAVIRLTLAAVRPARRWRGRVYDAEARTARRSGT
jgi:dolichol-phosphate mannosyltransferase